MANEMSREGTDTSGINVLHFAFASAYVLEKNMPFAVPSFLPTILVSIWCDSRHRSIPTSRSLSRFTDPVRRSLRSRFPYFLYILFLFSDQSLLGSFLFNVLDLWNNDSALTEMHVPFIFFRVLQMRVSALCNTQRFESMSLFPVRCKIFFFRNIIWVAVVSGWGCGKKNEFWWRIVGLVD